MENKKFIAYFGVIALLFYISGAFLGLPGHDVLKEKVIYQNVTLPCKNTLANKDFEVQCTRIIKCETADITKKCLELLDNAEMIHEFIKYNNKTK